MHTLHALRVSLLPLSLMRIFALLSLSEARHVFHLEEAEDNSHCVSPVCMQLCVFQQGMSNFPISSNTKNTLVSPRLPPGFCLECTMCRPCWPLERALFCDSVLPPAHYSPTTNGDGRAQVEADTHAESSGKRPNVPLRSQWEQRVHKHRSGEKMLRMHFLPLDAA